MRYEVPPFLPLSRPLTIRAALLIALPLLGACSASPRFDGPLAARNQHPAQLTVGRLRPRTAEVPPSGGVRLDWRNAYSSLFLFGTGNGDSFEMDGEYLRTSVSARVGLSSGVDLEAELPFAHASGGFLDDFVVDWHSFWDFPDQGRDGATRGGFRVEAQDAGRTVYGLEPHGFHLLDVPLVVSWSVVPIGPERPYGLLVRGGVELPTGDDRRGYGSGEPDWMVGAVGELRTGPVAWNAHVEHTWAGTPGPARDAGFEFSDVLSLGAGGELALDDHWTALAQVEMDRSTLRQLDLRRASDDQWLLWTGLRARLADGFRMEVGIGEDLSQHIAPDFTAWLAFSLDLGAR